MRRRLLIIASLAVLAGGISFYFVANRPPPEPSWQGQTVTYWLRHVGNGPASQAAFQAFRGMGTNADPVLLAAFADEEAFLTGVYRRIYPKLPLAITKHISPPIDETVASRRAAGLVALNLAPKSMVPKLTALYKKLGPEKRLNLIAALYSYSPTGPPNADLVPLFTLACADPNPEAAQYAARCLDEIGPAAISAAPALSNLCGNANFPARMLAAQALWDITRQTNIAVPVLYRVLIQSTNGGERFWAADYLAGMKFSNPLVVTTLINTLTNESAYLSLSACASLGQMGFAARAAVPALQNAVSNSPGNSILSDFAKRALDQIEPKRAAVNRQ